MKRRDFIKGTAPAALLPFLINGYAVSAYRPSPLLQALEQSACDDHILVLIQLNGGNDGLNTVIPLDNYALYNAARTNIAIAENTVLKLTNEVGLHPQMTQMQQMFANGQLRVINGVGYPTPNYSHFRSTDIWLTASDYDQVIETGWMGRFLDYQYPGFPENYPNPAMPDPLAIQIGSVISGGLEGPKANMGMAFTDPTTYFNIVNGRTPVPIGQRAGEELDFVRKIGVQIEQFATPVKAAAAKAKNKSTLYPAAKSNPLADQLKIVAQLIAGGLKTRIYVVNLSGFDTHSYQTTGGAGSPTPHGTLLSQLSVAVNAFQDDLQLLGIQDRVLGMTFSEFGRRIKSNSSGGTDHGAAAPLFVFGTNVVSGVLGSTPDIPTSVSPEDNVPMQFDFRSVYASLLKDWFCVPQQAISDLLYRDFPLLSIVKGGSPTSIFDEVVDRHAGLTVSPHPVEHSCTISMNAPQGAYRMSMFDGTGREIGVISEGNTSGGAMQVPYTMSAFTSGTYYIRLQHSKGVAMLPVIKQ